MISFFLEGEKYGSISVISYSKSDRRVISYDEVNFLLPIVVNCVPF